MADVALLYSDSARKFLVPSLADLGFAPRAIASGLSQVTTQLTLVFNGNLEQAAAAYRRCGCATIASIASYGVKPANA